MSLLPPSQAEVSLFVLLLGGTALYLLRHFPLGPRAWESRLPATSSDETSLQARSVLASRWSSGLTMGLGTLVLGLAVGLAPGSVGLGPGAIVSSLGWAVGVWLCLLPLLLRSAHMPALRARYPELRGPVVPRALVWRSTCAWIVFLWGYELLFRGLLLLGLQHLIGPLPALAVSTALYTLAHLEKPGSEAASCLVLGLVFGWMTLETGAVWSAWLCHVLICLTSEQAAGRAHPEIIWGQAGGPSD